MPEFDFDFEAFDKEFEEALGQETEVETEKETETEEVEVNEEEVETDEVQTEDEAVKTEEETQTFKDDRQNKAFAELRRQAEENKKFADFVNALATDAGVKPEEVLNRYQERRVQAEAEKQGVPVEVIQRLNALETENATMKEQTLGEDLDNQIKSVIDKYGIKNDDPTLAETFADMLRNGVDPRMQKVDFEKFYRAANFDRLVQMEVEKTRQTDLDAKKKRQEQAAIPNGSSATQSDDILDQAAKDAKDILANW